MANMILNVSGDAEQAGTKTLEIYRDVSMDAKPMTLPETDAPGYFVGRLVNAKAVKNSLK